jgi:Peptidase family M28
VIIAAFDGEEPPFYLSPAMGSIYFASHPTVPLDHVDMMVCMDLVGHAMGGDGLPSEVTSSLFALGSERSGGTGAHVDALTRAVPGVVIRRADAEIIPPLSDYAAFWERQIPFLFLTCGRSRFYHTPEDTPDRLAYPKMAATAGWLERFVRETCARPEEIPFLLDVRDDASTLRSIVGITTPLAAISPQGQLGLAAAKQLLAACDRSGRLPDAQRVEAQNLIALLEAGLA